MHKGRVNGPEWPLVEQYEAIINKLESASKSFQATLADHSQAESSLKRDSSHADVEREIQCLREGTELCRELQTTQRKVDDRLEAMVLSLEDIKKSSPAEAMNGSLVSSIPAAASSGYTFMNSLAGLRGMFGPSNNGEVEEQISDGVEASCVAMNAFLEAIEERRVYYTNYKSKLEEKGGELLR